MSWLQWWPSIFSSREQAIVDLSPGPDPDVDALTARVELLALGTLDDKLAYIASLQDSEKSKQAFVTLTEQDLVLHDRVRLIDAFYKMHRTTDEFNSFAHTSATLFFEAGELERARATAMKLSCPKRRSQQKMSHVEVQRNALLFGLAETYFAQEKYDSVYDCISIIGARSKQKNHLLMRLGDRYLDLQNVSEALNFYRQIDDKNFGDEREKRLGILATHCITSQQWKYAELAIREIVHDETAKAQLVSQLVNQCRYVGCLDQAFEILGRFTIFETAALREEIEALYCPIFDTYEKAGDDENAKKCLNKLFYMILQNEFSINGVDRAFSRNVNQMARIQMFGIFLVEQYLSEIKDAFKTGDNEYVICHLRNIASKYATLEVFKRHFTIKEEDPSSKPLGFSYDAYELLNLPFGASIAEKKKRFNQLRLKYHPDKVVKGANESNEAYQNRLDEAIAMFHKVQEAYIAVMGD